MKKYSKILLISLAFPIVLATEMAFNLSTDTSQSKKSILDPGENGVFPVGEVELDDPNGIKNIPYDPNGIYGSAYHVNLAWAKIMYPAQKNGIATKLDTTQESFPLVLFLHGRHATCDSDGNGPSLNVSNAPCQNDSQRIPNHEGYNYIMRALASQGIIAISVSAHEINPHNDRRNIENRGRLVIQYLKLLHDWNANGSGPFGNLFQGKIDMTRIGLSGHSRGGEGVVAAESMNQSAAKPFSIVAVNAIAPTDASLVLNSSNPYRISTASFFLLLGARDGDVWDFQGNRIYDRSYRIAGPKSKDKMSINIYGANHNYFNTIWTDSRALGTANPWGGARDDGDYVYPCDSEILSSDQRNIAKSLICAFFRFHLLGETNFRPVLTGEHSLAHIPKDKIFTAFQDKSRITFDHFEDSPTNLSTNSVGGGAIASGFDTSIEALLCNGPSDYQNPPFQVNRFFHSTIGLNLKWSQDAYYVTEIPTNYSDFTVRNYLSLRIAIAPRVTLGTRADPPINVDLRLIDSSRDTSNIVRSDSYSIIPQPFRKERPRSNELISMINLSTVRVPVKAFKNVDLGKIEQIRIDFTGANELGLDDIELTN